MWKIEFWSKWDLTIYELIATLSLYTLFKNNLQFQKIQLNQICWACIHVPIFINDILWEQIFRTKNGLNIFEFECKTHFRKVLKEATEKIWWNPNIHQMLCNLFIYLKESRSQYSTSCSCNAKHCCKIHIISQLLQCSNIIHTIMKGLCVCVFVFISLQIQKCHIPYLIQSPFFVLYEF